MDQPATSHVVWGPMSWPWREFITSAEGLGPWLLSLSYLTVSMETRLSPRRPVHSLIRQRPPGYLYPCQLHIVSGKLKLWWSKVYTEKFSLYLTLKCHKDNGRDSQCCDSHWAWGKELKGIQFWLGFLRCYRCTEWYSTCVTCTRPSVKSSAPHLL